MKWLLHITGLFLIIILLSCSSNKDENSAEFREYLDSGKTQVKRAIWLEIKDITKKTDYYAHEKLRDSLTKALESIKAELFEKAAKNLEKALKISPDNPEVNYFLGSVWDKYYSIEVYNNNFLRNMTLEKTEKISKYFEHSLKRSPVYDGELLVLDPVSKIGNTWATLAISYLDKGKPDSARWALQEGKKRGGFSDVTLAYCRDILASCDPNAILFVNGDNDTFPMWYLQLVEGFRKDVTFINLSLANLPWYIRKIKYSGYAGGEPIPFSFPDETLSENVNDPMAISYSFSETKDFKIPIKSIPSEYMKYSAKNSGGAALEMLFHCESLGSGNSFLMKISDKVIIDIIQQLSFSRPVYFSETVGNDQKSLSDYLVQEGFALKVVPFDQASRAKAYMKYNEDLMDNFFLRKPHAEAGAARTSSFLTIPGEKFGKENADALRLVSSVRGDMITYSYYTWDTYNDKAKCLVILDSMNAFLPENSVKKVPYDYIALAQFYKKINDEAKFKETITQGIELTKKIADNPDTLKNEKRDEIVYGWNGPFTNLAYLYYLNDDKTKAKSTYLSLKEEANKYLGTLNKDEKYFLEPKIMANIDYFTSMADRVGN